MLAEWRVNYPSAMATLEPPLQVTTTPEIRARVKTIADREGLSQAQVLRDIISIGIGEREEWSEKLLPAQNKAPTRTS